MSPTRRLYALFSPPFSGSFDLIASMGDAMLKSLIFAGLIALGLAAPAAAQTTGGIRAQCQIMGQPAELQLGFEAYGGFGVTYGPGVQPSITGVISDGGTTVYWNGVLRSAAGQLPISGENYFLRFYDANVYNRETVLEVTMTSASTFYLTDVYGNYPGNHPCQIVQAW